MKQQLRVLFFCVFIVMIGYGLGLPLLPYYIEKLATDAGETAHQAAFHVGAITGIFALAQFVFAPLFGRWSDRSGRRPFFLIGLAGYAISSMLIGFSSGLRMLYRTRVVGGILSAATLGMATVYVAGVTSDEERARYMAWLGSAIGLGVVAGPALGGSYRNMTIEPSLLFPPTPRQAHDPFPYCRLAFCYGSDYSRILATRISGQG